MRSVDAQMKEILRRKAYFRARRHEKRLAFLDMGLTAMLLAALWIAPGIRGGATRQEPTTLGATILGPEAGGYVLVGLLAFSVGVVSAALVVSRRKMSAHQGRTDDEDERR